MRCRYPWARGVHGSVGLMFRVNLLADPITFALWKLKLLLTISVSLNQRLDQLNLPVNDHVLQFGGSSGDLEMSLLDLATNPRVKGE